VKLRIILILAVLAISFSLLSCITSRYFNVEVSCDQFNTNSHAKSDFQVEIGDKINVKLCSNPTTGFQWTYHISGGNVIKEEDHDFEEPGGEGVVGAAGKEVWTFEAVEKGTTEVRMAYSQPWQGGEKEEWTYTMSVTVE